MEGVWEGWKGWRVYRRGGRKEDIWEGGKVEGVRERWRL